MRAPLDSGVVAWARAGRLVLTSEEEEAAREEVSSLEELASKLPVGSYARFQHLKKVSDLREALVKTAGAREAEEIRRSDELTYRANVELGREQAEKVYLSGLSRERKAAFERAICLVETWVAPGAPGVEQLLFELREERDRA